MANGIEAFAMAIADGYQRMRVATGFDAHPLVAGRPLVLGGVEIVFDKGLDGHSDGDAVCHAIIDGLLGIAGLEDMRDIGERFPSTDENLRNVKSRHQLGPVGGEINHAGVRVC
jgi:2-C-methyl-D-erythritol 2,4-cyclodiphosphate synthase